MNARLPIDDQLLIALWPTRVPERLLETRLGRPSSAIYRRARALGLPPRVALRESLGDFRDNTIKKRARRERRAAQKLAEPSDAHGHSGAAQDAWSPGGPATATSRSEMHEGMPQGDRSAL